MAALGSPVACPLAKGIAPVPCQLATPVEVRLRLNTASGESRFARLASCFGAVCTLATAGYGRSLTNSRSCQSRQRVARCALQETGSVKLNLVAGKATPAPPVGPAIGGLGCNIAMFVKEYNAMTAGKEGVVPVLVRVFNDRSFTLELKAPPAAELLLKVVGTISLEQLQQVAETKLPEMNIQDITRAMKIVHGTAKSVGVEVEGYDEWLARSAFPPPKNILGRYGAGTEMLPKVGEETEEEEEEEEEAAAEVSATATA